MTTSGKVDGEPATAWIQEAVARSEEVGIKDLLDLMEMLQFQQVQRSMFTVDAGHFSWAASGSASASINADVG